MTAVSPHNAEKCREAVLNGPATLRRALTRLRNATAATHDSLNGGPTQGELRKLLSAAIDAQTNLATLEKQIRERLRDEDGGETFGA